MNIEGYKKSKGEKLTEIRVLGALSVMMFTPNYDPATGQKLPDSADQINLPGLQKDLENLDAQIAQLNSLREDIVELIADVQQAIAESPHGAKK